MSPFNILLLQVKHAQCFDVALMDDGSVVLASKDYRLYIYRYVQVVTNFQATVVYFVHCDTLKTCGNVVVCIMAVLYVFVSGHHLIQE